MPKVVFSFDTEDYVNPQAAEGILRISRLVRAAGIIPCHNVVGWTALALEKWGRQDIIEEIKCCELATHSLKHSYHPTINEYTDLEDFDEAMRLFRKEEDENICILKRVFGDKEIIAACPPGASCSFVAHYGYADMGIALYDGGLTVDSVRNRPVWFCNLLELNYDFCYDKFGEVEKSDVEEIVERYADQEIWIPFHHPAKNAILHYTDLLNFNGANIEGEWKLSPQRSSEWVAKFEDNVKYLLKLLQSDPRYQMTTYKEIAEQYNTYRVVKPRHLPALCMALREEFFPVTLPLSLSLSDILLACRDFLLGKDEHVCGKIYGFLDTPYAVDQPVKVSLDELKASALQIPDHSFLPTRITVGEKVLGPADWLRAALACLSGEEQTVVVPDKWQIDLNEFPALRDQCFKGSWIHSSSLEDRYLSARARLQSWTIRLTEGSKRKIF